MTRQAGTHGLGWKPQLPDHRDFRLAGMRVLPPLKALPPALDMRKDFTPIRDQGALGSCTAFAGDGAFGYAAKKAGQGVYVGSALALYWDERNDQGDVANDTGATLRETMKALATYGLAPETDWPYDVAVFAQEPPANAVSDALKHTVKTYMAVAQDAVQIKQALFAGYPVIVGISVYESFPWNGGSNGDVPMPGPSEQLLGGHALCLAGYDDKTQRFVFRNSWGTAWGSSGYGTIPYAYLTDPGLSSDFWALEVVSGPPPPGPPPPPQPGPKHVTHTISVYSDGSIQAA